MRFSLVVETDGLAHPRTIKEIMHARPVKRKRIKYYTTSASRQQSQSVAEALAPAGPVEVDAD
jgi:hypothetical protein